ncbi:MAG: hypothetical protein M3R35_07675 [Candidatus Eremiobacteraeota bacterium]|nr:hypothetical protein [Candidatus Eremiobacteraeota bacterium]
MLRKRNATAAICSIVSLFAFAAAPASAAQYVVRSDTTVGSAVVEVWFRAPGAGYANDRPGIARVAVTAAAASRPSPHGTSFAETVRAAGGRLSISAYPDMVSVAVSAPANQAPAMLRALTRAYFAPHISADGLKSAQRDTAIAVAERRFSADRLLHDALFAQLFAQGPAHYPATPDSVKDVNALAMDEVQTFASRAFRSGNAVVTLAGNFDPSIVSNSQQPAGSAQPMEEPFDSVLSTAREAVVLPAAVAGTGLGYAGPPIADMRAATALDFVADYLFNPDTGAVAKAAVSEDSGAVLNGQFVTLHRTGAMIVTIASANKAMALRDGVLAAIDRLQSPLEPRTFSAALAAFEYHIESAVQTPQNQADNFGWYAAQGDANYAPGEQSGTYVRNVRSLDPQFVAATVRRYLQHPALVELRAAARPQETAQ